MSHQTLVVGIGSPHGDDRAGWDVIKALKNSQVNQACQARIAQSPLDLMSWLVGVDRLIICDACRSGGKIGRIYRFQWPDPLLMKPRWSGTHDLSVVSTIQLAERLNQLPPDVIWIAVEAGHTNPTTSMSPEVTHAVKRMVQMIMRMLNLQET